MSNNACLEIIGAGHRISLEPLSRQFPDAVDYWDGNWVMTRFTIELPAGRPRLHSPVTLTEFVHLGDLDSFRHGLEMVIERGAGDASLCMLEEYFTLSVTLDEEGAKWRGRIRTDSAVHPGILNVSDVGTVPLLFHIGFSSDPALLPQLLHDLEEIFVQWPLISPTYKTDGVNWTNKSIQVATTYLAKGGDPNGQLKRYSQGFLRFPTLLATMAHRGHVDAVRLLLDAGADLHAYDELALWCACANGQPETIELLIRRGAQINIWGNGGITPLMLAARNGTDNEAAPRVRLLLKAGADPNPLTEDGDSALLSAAGEGKEHVARLLLDFGANPNRKDRNGNTPLLRAAAGGHMGVVRLLKERGADVHLKDAKGRTALDRARSVGWCDPEVEEMLR